MSGGQVKNSMLVYFSLTRTSYLVTGQVKILMDLPGGQVKILRFFYPVHVASYTLTVYVDPPSQYLNNFSPIITDRNKLTEN